MAGRSADVAVDGYLRRHGVLRVIDVCRRAKCTLLRVPTASARAAVGSVDVARATVITVGIGETLIQLGLTPVVAVIPGLATALGVGAADAAWVLTVFILALAGTLLVCGRLGDLIGHRRMFGFGTLVYAFGAILGGLSTGLEMLLVARALQGVGAAMVSGNNLAILTAAVPVPQQGRAIAVVATTASVFAVAGAGFGTLVLAVGGWPLLFLAPAPLALWAAWRSRDLPDAEPRDRGGVDWLGAALLAITITVLAVALNHPHGTTTTSAMPIFHVALPVIAMITALLFVLLERRLREPLMDWRQLRHRGFAAAIGVNSVLHLTMMATMYLGPVLVVRGLGRSTTAGGMLMVVVQISAIGTAFLGGWLYDRTRAPWLRPAAAGILTAGFVLWAFSGIAGSYTAMLAVGLFTGLGTGVLLAVNNTVIMGSLPDDFRGVASGMLEPTRHFAHAFGVTIPTAILSLVVAGLAGAGGNEVALRWGFFWSCLGMAGFAGLGIVLALVPDRRG